MASTLVPRVLRASTLVAARSATLPLERARVVEEAGASLAQLALAFERPDEPAPLPAAEPGALRLLRSPVAPDLDPETAVPARAAPLPWVPPGRIVELCAGPDSAQTSAAVMVLREAQRDGDPVAWVMPRGAGLFPPDLAAAGVDLDALVVVHVPPDDAAAAPRAAELVLRTGAFGALVLDLGSARLPRGAAWQGRLLGLAREHACRVVVLSPHGRSRASLGPLVSLRFDVRRRRDASGRFGVVASALKDKSGLLATREAHRACLAPAGAR